MAKKNYIFNVVDGDPDNKVWEHAPVTASRSGTPKEFSRVDFLPEPMDQLSIGSCVGCSGMSVVSDVQHALMHDPSPMWIYKKAKEHDIWEGEDYSGTSILGACTALLKKGCCRERMWPYEDTESTEPLPGAEVLALDNKISSYHKVMITEKEQIKQLLLEKTLWFSFEIHQNIFKIDSSGVLKRRGYLNSERLGGHAVALIGWKYIDTVLYWMVRNSWGVEWGNNGNFFIEDALLEKVIHGGVYVVSVKNPIPVPEPVEPENDDVLPVVPEPVEPENDDGKSGGDPVTIWKIVSVCLAVLIIAFLLLNFQ